MRTLKELFDKIEADHYPGALKEHGQEALMLAEPLGVRLLPGTHGVDGMWGPRRVELKCTYASTTYDYRKDRPKRTKDKRNGKWYNRYPKFTFHSSIREKSDCHYVDYLFGIIKGNSCVEVYHSRQNPEFHKYLCKKIQGSEEFCVNLSELFKFGLTPIYMDDGGCPEVYPPSTRRG